MMSLSRMGLLTGAVVLWMTLSGRAAGENSFEPYATSLRLAWQSYERGEHAKALAQFEAATAASPNALEPKLGALLPLLAMERYARVEKECRAILKEHPANYYANLRLAQALRLQGKPGSAEPILAESLKRYPADAALLVEMGLQQQALNQGDKARQLFQDALCLDPDNAVAQKEMQSPGSSGAASPAFGSSSAFRQTGKDTENRANATLYGGWIKYQKTLFKNEAQFAGAYMSLGCGKNGLLEGEADFLRIHYRNLPRIDQMETTLAYANYSIPNIKIRLGGHLVTGDDRFTDGGIAGFGGVHYYQAGKWEAGLEGYYSHYPDFVNRLELIQLTPNVGIKLYQDKKNTLRSDLKAYWIHAGQPLMNRRDFLSVEERLSFYHGRWALAAIGWYGRQMFALRNDGFTVYNVIEEHRGGYGAEVKYSITERINLGFSATRERFKEFGGAALAESNLYLGMLSVSF